ncbi:MAG: type I restriction endonuclease [Bryobacteraceae bacterium]|jgi:type I restriction enzyme R subunit
MSIPATGKPEDRARANIDRLLTAAGWLIQNRNSINIEAGRGIAIREFPLASGHGFADYLLYTDGYAAGVVEAKKAGEPLTEVEVQTARYSEGLPWDLPALRRPLPFLYESTGVETRFTNLLDPDARSRPVFGFHRPETLIAWIESHVKSPAPDSATAFAKCRPSQPTAFGTTSTASSSTWKNRSPATTPAPSST